MTFKKVQHFANWQNHWFKKRANVQCTRSDGSTLKYWQRKKLHVVVSPSYERQQHAFKSPKKLPSVTFRAPQSNQLSYYGPKSTWLKITHNCKYTSCLTQNTVKHDSTAHTAWPIAMWHAVDQRCDLKSEQHHYALDHHHGKQTDINTEKKERKRKESTWTTW